MTSNKIEIIELTDIRFARFAATKTKLRVARPKKIERHLDTRRAELSDKSGMQSSLMKSSRVIAAKEFIPDDTVLQLSK